MKPCRLHITGASGSGTTTLARALGQVWDVPVHDTDDYFWRPTDPPFAARRPPGERIALMEQLFLPRARWILSGSLVGWGAPVAARFQAAVFLRLDPAERLRRLEARETARYGPAIAPGGPMHRAYRDFMDWAAGYDDPSFSGRSLLQHRHWLAGLAVPVIELDSTLPVAALVDAIRAAPDAP